MESTFDLTTIFTPPTSCLESTFTLFPAGLDVYQSGTVTRGIQPQCYPSNFREMHEKKTMTGSPEIFVNGNQQSTIYPLTSYRTFYSPGVCPSGYSTATAAWNSSTFSAACCPSDYSLGSNTVNQTCMHTILGDFMTLMDGSTNQTLPYPATAVAAPVLIAYAANDQPLIVTDPATVGSATASSVLSPVATTSTLPPTQSSSTTQSPQVSHQLTTGAQAGIGVGVSIAAISLVVGIVLICLRRRRNNSSSIRIDSAVFEKAELPNEPPAGVRQGFEDRAEIGGEGAKYEANQEAAVPLEMDDRDMRAELPGDYDGLQVPGRDMSVDHRHEAPA